MNLDLIKIVLSDHLAAIIGRGTGNKAGLEIEVAADPLDRAANEASRYSAAAMSERDKGMAEAIRDALQRIEDGSYGLCAGCEEEIAPKRLLAVPWAILCVPCQSNHERHEANRNAKPPKKLTDHGRSMEAEADRG